MQHIYERLVELLGKPRPRGSELLVRLIEDLGESPVVDCSHDRVWIYQLSQSGIQLFFDTKTGMFWSLTLEIATAQVRAGYVRAYDGDLPYGINRSDARDTVESKFPGGTLAVKDYRFDADLRPLVITFHFQAPDPDSPGVGEQQLTMVTAQYINPALRGLCQEDPSWFSG